MNFSTIIFLLFSCVVFKLNAQQKDRSTRQLSIYSLNERPVYSSEKSTICGETTAGEIGLIDCSEVGTAAFNSNSLSDVLDYSATVSTNNPSPAPTCWDGYEYVGNWEVYDLADGVTSLSVQASGLGTGSSLYEVWMTFYQGTDCSNLSEVACESIVYRTASGYYYNDLIIENLDPDQKLWVYTSGDDIYALDADFRGMTTPDNESCSTSLEESNGCNVGAAAETSWTGPTADGVICSGTVCDWILDLTDSGGNGWNTAYIRITVDGITIGTYSISSGSSASYTFSIDPDLPVVIAYIDGSQDNQNAYTLTDPYGDVVLSGGMPNNSATLASFTSYCSHTWYSNENTVYYTFTATDANATIDVDNVICNDGTVGEAQFGVWKDCADVGDYGANFVGCAVGSGTLSMPALTVGESYVIAVDGQAGDICTWDFLTTGIILPTEFVGLNAESYKGYNTVEWSTASERNADKFVVERSLEGKSFEAIGEVTAVGNSDEMNEYLFVDHNPVQEQIWYRLKQVDKNGAFVYHGPVKLNYVGNQSLSVIPNPTKGEMMVNYLFEKNEKYSISIIDLSGRIVFNEEIESSNLSNNYHIDAHQLISGAYILHVASNKNQETIKFIKE